MVAARGAAFSRSPGRFSNIIFQIINFIDIHAVTAEVKPFSLRLTRTSRPTITFDKFLGATMNIIRAASGGLMGILCLLILQSCGGGGGYGGSSPSPTPITISVQPTTVVAGQSATVTWSVT